MTACKVCGSGPTVPLFGGEVLPFLEHPPVCRDAGPWRRCLACGCDSSAVVYEDMRTDYGAEVLERRGDPLAGDREALVRESTSNYDLFEAHRGLAPGIDFLDVGCCEGAALTGMQDRGWRVHGFDVIPEVLAYGCTTVAPEFRASLFPRKYAAVLCREVIEHVGDWRGLLAELHAATLPGGLVQVQTPRPTPEACVIPYQRRHLQLFAPLALRYSCARRGSPSSTARCGTSGRCGCAGGKRVLPRP